MHLEILRTRYVIQLTFDVPFARRHYHLRFEPGMYRVNTCARYGNVRMEGRSSHG